MQATIGKLSKKDAGRGIVSVNEKFLSQLGCEEGDYVVLKSPNSGGKTLGQVFATTTEDGRIHIDGELRRNLNANVDEEVQVAKKDLNKATEIEITIPNNLNTTGDMGAYLRDKIRDRAVYRTQQIPVSIGFGRGDKIPVKITGVAPDAAVYVAASTDIQVTEHTQSQETREVKSGHKDTSDSSSASTDEETAEGVPDVTYEDLGGLDDEIEKVREMVELPISHPELFTRLGVDPPRGVLLEGPPGTGKTMMAKAVANEVQAHFINVSGPEIMSKHYGEAEEKLRDIFERAKENEPSIIFFDEIDAIVPSRDEADGDVGKSIVAQMLSLMDGVEDAGKIVVMAATNRADAIDGALRRGGRFDRELEIGVPDKDGRREILQIHSREMPLTDDVDLDEYSSGTHGYVGADLASLTKEAAMNALRRVRPNVDVSETTLDAELLQSLIVTEDDFKQALHQTEPSAMREVRTEVPDVSWDDVGGLAGTKEDLKEMIQWPMDHPDAFDAMGVDQPKGVLLYGPPGTGKTLLAKAVASSANTNFISVKGPELMNKWVGESEKAIREVFSKARENAPTVIFFDEIDSIAGERGGDGGGNNKVNDNMVTQLLTEMDGLEGLEDVVVIAATNRPDMLDSALMRPGRFDRHIHVPVPDAEAREAVFNVHLSNKPVGDGIDTTKLANDTEGYVGADIESICREAAMKSMREYANKNPDALDSIRGNAFIETRHIQDAIGSTAPSVDEEKRRQYEEFEQKNGN